MGWIVITILFFIVTAGAIVVVFGATERATRLAAIGAAACAIVVWIVVSFAMSVHTVGQLQVGLVYNFSGTLQHSTGHGVIWVAPWQHVKTENIGLQSVEFSLDQDNAAVSQDQQQIFGDIQLNYEVEPTDVVHLYKTVGSSWKEVLLESRMLQDFKQVTSTYTAAQITTERAALRSDTRTLMQKELAPYGIKVVDVLIKNLGYSADYRAAVTQKTIQVQKALQAKAKVAQAQYEADQAVATAKGKAESNLVVAEAQAKAITLKGKAIKNNPDVLKLEAIDKLNPQASIVICSGPGNDNCPAFLPTEAQQPVAAAPTGKGG